MNRKRRSTSAPPNWEGCVFQSLSDALFLADKAGNVVLMNLAAEQLSGLRAVATRGRQLHDVLRLERQATKVRIKLPVLRSFTKNPRPREFPRLTLTTLDGTTHEVDAVIAPLHGHVGSLIGLMVVLRDVSRALILERDLVNRNKIETIGNLSGNIAHDFGKWLNIISGHASSIVERLIPNTRAHEEATRLLAAAEHAGGLARRLLRVASTIDAKREAEPKPVATDTVIRDAVNTAEAAFGDNRIVFKWTPSDTAHVQADPVQLFECLMNVIRNAVDAMPKGGRVTIDTTERLEAGQTFVVIRVRDTGAGMLREVQDKAFEPFFSTRDSGSAMGLGLTVVQTTLQRWGGDIRIRSRADHGTSVRLFIPRADIQPDPAAPLDRHAGSETVLIADDNVHLLEQTGTILRDAGYRVHAAQTGRDCVALFRKYSGEIDLTIIDVVMPGKDGRSTLHDIRALDPTAAVVMTSGFSRDFVRGYLEVSAWGFVQKPFDADTILSVVRHTLDRRHPTLTTRADGG